MEKNITYSNVMMREFYLQEGKEEEKNFKRERNRLEFV